MDKQMIITTATKVFSH